MDLSSDLSSDFSSFLSSDLSSDFSSFFSSDFSFSDLSTDCLFLTGSFGFVISTGGTSTGGNSIGGGIFGVVPSVVLVVVTDTTPGSLGGGEGG